MDATILEDVKKIVGYTEDYDVYDQELIMHANSAFMTLWQLGVGNLDAPFVMDDGSEEWTDFYPDINLIPMVKTYVCLKVKSVHDPAGSSYVINANQSLLQEYEWRLQIQAEMLKDKADE